MSAAWREEPGRPGDKPSDVFVIAAWFGVMAGFVEASVLLFIQSVPGLITWPQRQLSVSGDFLWIAPLVDVLLFITAAVPLAVGLAVISAAPWLRALRGQGLAVLPLAATAAYVAFRVPDRLYWWAVVALSLGLAVRCWLWWRTNLVAHLAWFKRSLVLSVAAVAVVATLARGGSWLLETRSLQALPPAPSGVPDVLMIVLDTVRADHLSVYGYERPTTPGLSQLAAQGVLFERAISPSSWTLPSHASLFTGLHVHEHGADSARPFLDTNRPTLAEVLGEQGFATGGFSANTRWVTRNSGIGRGFGRFEDHFRSSSNAISRTVLGREVVARLRSFIDIRGAYGGKTAPDVTNAFLEWLDGVSSRPVFAFLNYFDAHGPYISPSPYQVRFMTNAQRIGERGFAFAPPMVESETEPGEESLYAAAYDGAINYLDSEIDRLLQELEARGRLDRTLVVITADHGEAFAEHGFYAHGHSLYMDQVHVPLIFRLPSVVPAGIRIAAPVSTAEVPATILSLLGLAGQSGIPGSSLRRFWEESAPPVEEEKPLLSEVGARAGVRPEWPILYGWVRSLVSGDRHFIQYEDGRAELYDLSTDPKELTDVADTAEGRAPLEDFQRHLGLLVSAPMAGPGDRR